MKRTAIVTVFLVGIHHIYCMDQGLIQKNNLGGSSHTNLFLTLGTGGSEGVLKPPNGVW